MTCDFQLKHIYIESEKKKPTKIKKNGQDDDQECVEPKLSSTVTEVKLDSTSHPSDESQ